MKPNLLKLKDVNFDNEKEVEKLKDNVVEIPVGALAYLLDYFYAGGGEPDQLNKRLALALKNGKNL